MREDVQNRAVRAIALNEVDNPEGENFTTPAVVAVTVRHDVAAALVVSHDSEYGFQAQILISRKVLGDWRVIDGSSGAEVSENWREWFPRKNFSYEIGVHSQTFSPTPEATLTEFHCFEIVCDRRVAVLIVKDDAGEFRTPISPWGIVLIPTLSREVFVRCIDAGGDKVQEMRLS